MTTGQSSATSSDTPGSGTREQPREEAERRATGPVTCAT